MAGAYSISVAQGDTAGRHDRRDYIPENVDGRLVRNDVVILDEGHDPQKWFNDLFADAIEEYNARQTRNDRKKSADYYSEIMNSKRNPKPKPFYEYVVQIGNRDTNGVTTKDFDAEEWKKDKDGYDLDKVKNNSPERLELKEILTQVMQELPERYPSLKFCCIIGHDDEPNGTFHYHIRFTPKGKGGKQGLSEQCSLTRAMNEMGFKSNDGEYAIHQWQNDLKDYIEECMNQKGYERQFMSNEEKRLSLPLYKREAQLKEREDKAEQAALDSYMDMQADSQIERMFFNQERSEELGELAYLQHIGDMRAKRLLEERIAVRSSQEKLNAQSEALMNSRKETVALNGALVKAMHEVNEMAEQLKAFVPEPQVQITDVDAAYELRNTRWKDGTTAFDRMVSRKQAKEQKKAQDVAAKAQQSLSEVKESVAPAQKKVSEWLYASDSSIAKFVNEDMKKKDENSRSLS